MAAANFIFAVGGMLDCAEFLENGWVLETRAESDDGLEEIWDCEEFRGPFYRQYFELMGPGEETGSRRRNLTHAITAPIVIITDLIPHPLFFWARMMSGPRLPREEVARFNPIG